MDYGIERVDLHQTMETVSEIKPIEQLQTEGVGMPDILRLKTAGLCTIQALFMMTKRNLCKIKGMSEMKADKLKEIAAKLVEIDFQTASELCEKRKSVLKISTGSAEVDKILGGGIQTMSITEVFGEFRTGKTQLCLTMCVTTQLDIESGGGQGKVAFIDTEGTFRPERLKEIAERYQLDVKKVLDNVIFARAYNSDHQNDLLSALSAKFTEDQTFKLLIIDSIIALFRTDFIGRGELGERQQKLNVFLQRLMKLAEEFNLAVLITNQMMSDPSATMSFVSDPKKPIGGHVLAHASTTRIYLRKGRDDIRIAKIYDSPDMPEAEAQFSISPEGVKDVSE
ncbi:Meiotic recombination protein DMC1/LIM15 like protein [Cucumispora dikerogammari]|nr:Meiotic recombination protein DMC1/LIM15 like protein [Cucumispora dikerogammari]